MPQAAAIDKLSGSTNGLGIKVTGTSSAADVTVHTAVSGVTHLDLVTVYAVNQHVSDVRDLTLAFGGETDPDNLITIPIPARSGKVLVLDRLPLRNGLVVGAWADAANDVILYGSVIHLTNT